ncbi:phosphotransferase family protein, partial [Saprospiraceae bacterium]|nr:phosphotransferase family protein [Saprospiraceae bacterium]
SKLRYILELTILLFIDLSLGQMKTSNQIDKPQEVRTGEALDWTSLEKYLRDNIEDIDGDMAIMQFHGGHANLTYLVKFGDRELIVRRPPFGKIAPGAHDMKREYKVLSKLTAYFSPAPQAYHLCEDDSVIGSMFVVMERRTGVVVRTKVLDCFLNFDNVEERLTAALIQAEADLHKVDYKKAGLEKLGRPEGFLERQLEGWGQRWHLSKTSENKGMDEVLRRLQSDIPTSQAATIVHNDIKLDNCQFQSDNPDKVTSMFDWDMCTLGDPLIDFGTTLSYWPEPFFAGVEMPIMLYGDFPNKEFLIDKYASLTGFDLQRIKWYEAFAYWKGAVIGQQLYERYLKGASTDDRMKKFEKAPSLFTDYALSIL